MNEIEKVRAALQAAHEQQDEARALRLDAEAQRAGQAVAHYIGEIKALEASARREAAKDRAGRLESENAMNKVVRAVAGGEPGSEAAADAYTRILDHRERVVRRSEPPTLGTPTGETGETCEIVAPEVNPATDEPGACPTCGSPSPGRHPAVQSGGEVEPCPDLFHDKDETGRPIDYDPAVEAIRVSKRREGPICTCAFPIIDAMGNADLSEGCKLHDPKLQPGYQEGSKFPKVEEVMEVLGYGHVPLGDTPFAHHLTKVDGEKKPSKALTKYVDKAMFESEPMDAGTGADGQPKGYLLSATPDPLGAIAAYAMMYEGRVIRDLREITDEERKLYWEDCFKTALQTPLEAFDLHFMVEGITRASWDQMVRQRTAAFAGESLRFAVKEPLSDAVRSGPMVTGENEAIWLEAVESIESAYNRLIANGVPAEDARGLLPLNVLVRGHWKTNFRNFYNEVGKRLCTQAQWEWRAIHASLREAIGSYRPHVPGMTPLIEGQPSWQFQHIAASNVFKPICFQKGACMFKAKADRGCTIRGRVDAGRFDQIDPREWLLDPAAAHVRTNADWAQKR